VQFVYINMKDNQETFRLGLGLVTLSSLSPGGGVGAEVLDQSIRRSFSVLNEQYGWSVALQVLRPPWWPDVDPMTGKTILPE
jgi:hypothetical protein